jgi:hypothetical protein
MEDKTTTTLIRTFCDPIAPHRKAAAKADLQPASAWEASVIASLRAHLQPFSAAPSSSSSSSSSTLPATAPAFVHMRVVVPMRATQRHRVARTTKQDVNTTGTTFGGHLLRLGYEHGLELAQAHAGERKKRKNVCERVRERMGVGERV